MNKELTLEEAENIVDNMYQNRWKECGVEDGNTIHMGNLSNLKYNELESASILLLRTEIRLKKENKILKERIEYLERSNNRREDTILEQRQEISNLEDNWNKLREYIRETKLKEFEKSYSKRFGKTFTQAEVIVCNMILDKMQELEGDNNE